MKKRQSEKPQISCQESKELLQNVYMERQVRKQTSNIDAKLTDSLDVVNHLQHIRSEQTNLPELQKVESGPTNSSFDEHKISQSLKLMEKALIPLTLEQLIQMQSQLKEKQAGNLDNLESLLPPTLNQVFSAKGRTPSYIGSASS